MMTCVMPDDLFDPLYTDEERADPEDIRLGLAVPDGWAHRRRDRRHVARGGRQTPPEAVIQANGYVYGWHDHRQRQRDLDRLHNLSD